VEPSEPAGCDPSRHRVLSEPARGELSRSHDPVLPRGEICDASFSPRGAFLRSRGEYLAYIRPNSPRNLRVAPVGMNFAAHTPS